MENIERNERKNEQVKQINRTYRAAKSNPENIDRLTSDLLNGQIFSFLVFILFRASFSTQLSSHLIF